MKGFETLGLSACSSYCVRMLTTGSGTLPNEANTYVRGLCFCSSFIVKLEVLEYTSV